MVKMVSTARMEKTAQALSRSAPNARRFQFSSIYDVFGCLRPTEKVTFILRHAARPSDKYGPNDPLNETGMQQCATVGNRLKEMNLDDFSYMHTYYFRAKQSAWIIAKNKGQDVGTETEWYSETDNEYQTTNNDLLEKVYVKNESKRNSCKSGWGGFSKAAYRDYSNSTEKSNCESGTSMCHSLRSTSPMTR